MDAKNLEKTYNIRIPVAEFSDYYLNTLLKSVEKEGLKREIEAFERFEESLGGESAKDFKYKLIESSVAHLKGIFQEKVNSWEAPENFVLETNDFKPEHEKIYISFDVRQANWTVSKYFLGLDFPVWEEYVQKELNFPEALAYSKPLRQAILGQVVNPKRYDRMQKYLTWKHLEELSRIPESSAKVVSVNSEEIILEVLKKDDIFFWLDGLNEWLVPVRLTIFETKIHTNYGDTIIVKEFLNEDWTPKYKSLYAVNGHRFYIHFKTLILGEELEDKDLLFKQDGKLFKWCGTDLKDYREYDYVKKWIKPLKWETDDRNACIDGYDKILYFVMKITEDNITLLDVREKEQIILPCKNFHYKEVVSDYHYKKIKNYIED
jgi:hypothetical protein